jgi:DNA-binding transcriptional LysR family regulator
MQSNREDLSALAIFVAVAGHRSFRRAAAELGVSPSALSHAVRDLETRLGRRLLDRTTRRVRPTEAGERLLRRLRPTFQDISAALSELDVAPAAPTQRLRINATPQAAELVLAPLLAAVLRDNPALRLDVVTEEKPTDILAGGFDAGLRYGERHLPNLTGLAIGPRQRWAVVAAPDYFMRHPAPVLPRDLRDHACIRYRLGSGLMLRWEFLKNGELKEVDVDGPLTLGDQDLMLRAAADGLGLAYVFEAKALQLIAAGQLVRVLEDWCPERSGFFLYYPTQPGLSPALRLLIDAAARHGARP